VKVAHGYKQTEIGVIPEEWDCLRIRDAAAKSPNAIVGGPFGSDLVSADYEAAGIPVIRGQNMSKSHVSGEFVFVSRRKARSLSANLARSWDLVFTQRGTLGQVSLVPDGAFEEYLISQSQMKVSLDRSRHDPGFVRQYFASDAGQKQILTSAIQTGVPHTNLGILRAYLFPAPPLPEQRAIAAALSDVDAVLGGLDRLIAKKRDLKQAAMQQLLTGQTRLPGFGGEWEVKRIVEFTNCVAGGTPSTLVPSYWGGSIKWMSSGELHQRRVEDVAGRITEDGLRNSAATILPKRCVLVGLAGQGKTRGTVALNMVELCTNQSIAAILQSAEFIPEYLYYNLDRRYEELRDLSSGGGGRGGLNLKLLGSISVPLPSIAEQSAIAAVISDMDAELAALEARRDKTRDLKQAMMQELLTGKTRLVPAGAACA
jgi:type I restriction enzyme S subunit